MIKAQSAETRNMKLMNITIERVKPSDAEAMLAYLKQIGSETDNLTFGKEGLPFTVEEEMNYIAGTENSSDEILLVAKDNGKIVGDASLSRLPRRMAHRGDLGIAVIKEYWNSGVGSRLMREIISLAKESSFDVIELQVRKDNLAAIHLYEKFGFETFGTHPSFFKINGENIAFTYMYKKI